ncbi:hypothetical protein D4V08_22165 [Escherichia coli]|nr:hypothetical protein [Escherichia coli]PWH35864.1 hypothetical protein DD768_23255 [Escherichia coli]PWH40396.1 hypothetical protein DD689_23755 [Escherichia coli]PWH50744.1 hypothetical protein DD680_23870 [Escherichia coli]PWH60131.1 hypothetical protein DD647_23850 [Escherichia coli]
MAVQRIAPYSSFGDTDTRLLINNMCGFRNSDPFRHCGRMIANGIHISFSFITFQIPEVLRAAITYPTTGTPGQTMDAVFGYKTVYI